MGFIEAGLAKARPQRRILFPLTRRSSIERMSSLPSIGVSTADTGLCGRGRSLWAVKTAIKAAAKPRRRSDKKASFFRAAVLLQCYPSLALCHAQATRQAVRENSGCNAKQMVFEKSTFRSCLWISMPRDVQRYRTSSALRAPSANRPPGVQADGRQRFPGPRLPHRKLAGAQQASRILGPASLGNADHRSNRRLRQKTLPDQSPDCRNQHSKLLHCRSTMVSMTGAS